jgi:uncharacterized membrane protein
MSTIPAITKQYRNLVYVAYVLHFLGSMTIFTSIAALVINYLKRREVPPPFDSHHRWMIRTFWWSLAWGIIGGVLTYIGIGYLILLGMVIWWFYRLVRGIITMADGRALPV